MEEVGVGVADGGTVVEGKQILQGLQRDNVHCVIAIAGGTVVEGKQILQRLRSLCDCNSMAVSYIRTYDQQMCAKYGFRPSATSSFCSGVYILMQKPPPTNLLYLLHLLSICQQ